MKMTFAGKLLAFVLAIMVVLGCTYFAGGFNFLKDVGSSVVSDGGNSDNGVAKKNGSKKSKASDEINISIDEWIGWSTIISANGGLKTQKGSIFDELGIKVNISVINDATQSSNALIKGDIDGAGYTVNRYAFLYPKFKENGVNAVMPFITNFSSGGDGIIAKDSIKSVEDLVGKKIAVPRYSEAQTLVWWLLNKSNLTEKEIEQIHNDMVLFDTPDDAAKAFFAGQVDAAATWQPYLSQAQETTGARLLFSTKAAHNIILDGIVFDKKFLDENKELVSKFIEGTLLAMPLYKTEFTSVKNSMPLFSTETNESIAEMAKDADLAGYAENLELLASTAKNLFVDMSDIWSALGEKSMSEEVDNAFETSTLELLSNKFDSKEVHGAPSFTEEQRQQAQQVDNVESLLKKSVTIEFQPNSAAFLDAEQASKVLDEFVGIAKILNGSVIQIEGNINDTGIGESEAGKKLSYQRAKTVSEYLKHNDVDPSRFVIVGNGISKQVGDNKTEAGKQQNRRTDIFFKIVE